MDPRGRPARRLGRLLGRGVAPPRPPGACAPLWPLNAATGTPPPVRQVWGWVLQIQKLVVEARRGGQGPDRRSRPSTAAGGGWGPCPSDDAQGKRSVGNAARCPHERVSTGGGQGPDRRSRPSTATGGGRGPCPRLPHPDGGALLAGDGWGAPAGGGDRGQRPLVGISREARERLCAAKSSEYTF